MFTDVYIGLVKSENFDYEKPGSPYGYSPDYTLESLKVGNKLHLRAWLNHWHESWIMGSRI